jgi:hypothetical protein
MLSLLAALLLTQGPILKHAADHVSAQDHPDAAATSPAGDALVIWSAGIEALAPDSSDRETLAALRELGLWALNEGFAESSADSRAGAALLGRWIQRPFAVRAGLSSAGLPLLQLSVRCASLEEAQSEALALGAWMESGGLEVASGGDDPCTQWAHTSGGTMAIGARATSDGAACMLSIGRPLDPDRPRPASAGLQTDAAALLVRWDARNLEAGLDAIVPQLNDEKQVEGFTTTRRVLEALDLIGAQAPRRTMALVHGETGSSTTTLSEGWSASRAAARGMHRITREDLAIVPQDAVWVRMGSVHPGAVLEFARELKPVEVAYGLAGFKQVTGVDAERDVLAPLGPLAGAYVARSSGGKALGGLVLFARARGANDVLRTLLRLVDMAVQSQDPAPVSRTAWTHAGRACSSLSFKGLPIPVEPSFTAVGDVLFLALSRNALRKAIDQLDSESSLLDHPGLAGMDEAALEGLVGFGLFDAPASLERGFANLNLGLTALGQFASGEGAPDLSLLLPDPSALSKGSAYSVSRTRVVGDDLVGVTTHGRSWLARGTALLGSPAGELNPMGMGIIASVAIPKLLSARLEANESAAIASLRSLASAQAQFQSVAALDRDGDGTGEYGLLGELSGGRPVRGANHVMEPAMLGTSFAQLTPDGAGGAVVQRSGYYYQVWLHDERSVAICDPAEPQSVQWQQLDPDISEIVWSAYAWPVHPGQTGNRAFYIDQEGDLLACDPGPEGFGGLTGTGGRAPRHDSVRAGGWETILAYDER